MDPPSFSYSIKKTRSCSAVCYFCESAVCPMIENLLGNESACSSTISNPSHSDDDQASRNPTFSKQQLELCIRNAVHSGQSLSATEKAFFPNPTSVPRAVKQFVMDQYQEYSIEALKCHFRDAARTMVQQGEFFSLQLSVRNDRTSF